MERFKCVGDFFGWLVKKKVERNVLPKWSASEPTLQIVGEPNG